jgi:hypothetical protein
MFVFDRSATVIVPLAVAVVLWSGRSSPATARRATIAEATMACISHAPQQRQRLIFRPRP